MHASSGLPPDVEHLSSNLWSWFQSYLTNRFQRITINHCLSDLLPVKSGVPQGSMLGPLLFIYTVFINDLPKLIRHSSILSFADDTKYYRVIHNESEMASLQLDLNFVSIWSTVNQLSLTSINMLCFMISLNPLTISESTSYSIDGHPLPNKLSHRDLGIIFSVNLNWASHYEFIIYTAYKSFGLLRRVFL